MLTIEPIIRFISEQEQASKQEQSQHEVPNDAKQNLKQNKTKFESSVFSEKTLPAVASKNTHSFEHDKVTYLTEARQTVCNLLVI